MHPKTPFDGELSKYFAVKAISGRRSKSESADIRHGEVLFNKASEGVCAFAVASDPLSAEIQYHTRAS